MAKRTITHINNSDTVRELEDAANIQLKDRIRRKIKPDVQAVINVNPKDYRIIDIVRHVISTSVGNTLIYTTSANKDFFLVAFNLGHRKTSTSITTTTRINVQIDGVGRDLGILKTPASFQWGENMALSFPIPIKIDSDSDILLLQNLVSGQEDASATIYGYEVQRI